MATFILKKHVRGIIHGMYCEENILPRDCTVEKYVLLLILTSTYTHLRWYCCLIGISLSQTHVYRKENVSRVDAHRVPAQHHQSVHLLLKCSVLIRSGTPQCELFFHFLLPLN